MIKNPTPVARAMAVNSFRSGLVHFFTKWMESLANCRSGSISNSWIPSCCPMIFYDVLWSRLLRWLLTGKEREAQEVSYKWKIMVVHNYQTKTSSLTTTQRKTFICFLTNGESNGKRRGLPTKALVNTAGQSRPLILCCCVGVSVCGLGVGLYWYISGGDYGSSSISSIPQLPRLVIHHHHHHHHHHGRTKNPITPWYTCQTKKDGRSWHSIAL